MKVIKAAQELRVKGPIGDFLSEKTLKEHYETLYKGYVNKYNEIQEKLTEANLEAANATYSEIRELKKEELFAADAIRLHEGYFDCLGGDGSCSGTILSWLNEDFGSFENWQKEFTAACMSARGWVVLAYDLTDGRLHNYLTDIHSDGVWAAVPLLICDMYEHAYYFDYTASGKKDYINKFLGQINWDMVNQKLEDYGLKELREAA